MKFAATWYCLVVLIAFAATLSSTQSPLSAEERTSKDFVLTAPPKLLPHLSLQTDTDRKLTYEAFRGKVTLLNLWATWCAPCRKEMPSLDRLQKQIGGPNFEVVALSLDQTGLARVLDFYDRTRIRHLHVYIDSSTKAMWSLSVSVLPTTLLISPNGHEVARIAGAANWDSLEMKKYLENWIKKLSAPSRPSRAQH